MAQRCDTCKSLRCKDTLKKWRVKSCKDFPLQLLKGSKNDCTEWEEQSE